MSDDTQEDAGDHCKEEVSIISTTSSSRSDDDYPKISFMIRLLSVKIITVIFQLSQTIDEVKREIQSQFGIYPSQYILKAGYKVLLGQRQLLTYRLQHSNEPNT